MNNFLTNQWRNALALSWLLLVFLAYLMAFPVTILLRELPVVVPFRPSIEPLRHFAMMLFFAAAAAGWGRPLTARLAGRNATLLADIAAGSGLMMLATLLLNACGLATRPFFFALYAAGTGLFAFRQMRRPFPRVVPRLTRSDFAFAATCIVFSAATLAAAFGPPTQFDSLVYHLAFPARYLSDGGMHFVPYNIFFAFPQNMEMLFQSALAVDTDILANLMSWLFYALTGAALYSFCRARYSMVAARAATLLWFSTPAVMFLAAGTYVDTALAFFCLMSFLTVVQAESHSNGNTAIPYGPLLLSGFFAGIALGIKYTAAAFVFPLAAFILFRVGGLGYILCFAAPLLAAFLPWLVKNAVLLNNPLAPWATGLFTASRVLPATAAGYFAHISGHGMPVHSLKDIVSLPWNMTVSGVLFGGAFDLPGPAWLMFAPLLFLRRENSRMTPLFFVMVFFAAAWLFSGKVMRFLVPVMPLAAVAAARGYDKYAKLSPRAASAILTAVVVHNLLLFSWIMAQVDPFAVVLRGEGRGQYLEKAVNYYSAVSRAVNRLTAPAKVLYWGETRSYYCTVPAIAPTVFDRNPLAVAANRLKDAVLLSKELKREGITHILVNRAEAARLHPERDLTAEGNRAFKALLNASPKIYEDRACTLHELP